MNHHQRSPVIPILHSFKSNSLWGSLSVRTWQNPGILHRFELCYVHEYIILVIFILFLQVHKRRNIGRCMENNAHYYYYNNFTLQFLWYAHKLKCNSQIKLCIMYCRVHLLIVPVNIRLFGIILLKMMTNYSNNYSSTGLAKKCQSVSQPYFSNHLAIHSACLCPPLANSWIRPCVQTELKLTVTIPTHSGK